MIALPNNRIHDAVKMAFDAHRDQWRKGGRIPYIVHPLEVMEEAIRRNLGPEMECAAVLHDVREDAPQITPKMIQDLFGERVLALVEGVTNTHPTKLDYVEWLRTQPDDDILALKGLDVISNLRSLERDLAQDIENPFGRFKGGKQTVRAYYRALCDVFEERKKTMTKEAHRQICFEVLVQACVVFPD